jgi:hypothetical protein
MHSVCHNYLLFYYFKCWQLVSARIDHHQANIYKNLKKSVHTCITFLLYIFKTILKLCCQSTSTLVIRVQYSQHRIKKHICARYQL